MVSASEALIAGPKLEILRREKYGRSADRAARLIDQLELQLEELETAAAEDAIRAGQAADKTTKVRGFDRRKPVKKPFPEHLPRERVVVEAPAACTCQRVGPDRVDGRGQLEPLMRHWFEQLPAVAPSVRARWRRILERNAGGGAAAVEGDPDRPREVHLSRLRE